MMNRTSKIVLTTSAMFLALFVGRPDNAQAVPLANTVTVQVHVAKACTISAATLDFITYDPTSTTDLTAQSDITFTCTVGTPVTVSLDNGHNLNGSMRGMAIGTNILPYQIYTDSTRNNVFVTSANQIATAGNNTVTMYGKIPAGTTSVIAGEYQDLVTATLNF